MPDPLSIFDAARLSGARTALPTALDTAGLRALGREVLGRAVFTARGTNAIFASKLKDIIGQLTAGDIGEGQARTALWEVLKALGYDIERGGFPGEELEPGIKGSLQDLMSFRRRDLIVRTQLDLMTGAGAQFRGQLPEQLASHPAWELVRVAAVSAPRDWPSRWAVAGGKPGRLIALKGDPLWGELGSYDNFSDALGTDHPPFCFNSGMGWREVSAADCERLGITGPGGETAAEWLDTQPRVDAGRLPLPAPQISLVGVDPELVDRFVEETGATEAPAKPGVFDYSKILEKEYAKRDAIRAARAAAEQEGQR